MDNRTQQHIKAVAILSAHAFRHYRQGRAEKAQETLRQARDAAFDADEMLELELENNR